MSLLVNLFSRSVGLINHAYWCDWERFEPPSLYVIVVSKQLKFGIVSLSDLALNWGKNDFNYGDEQINFRCLAILMRIGQQNMIFFK